MLACPVWAGTTGPSPLPPPGHEVQPDPNLYAISRVKQAASSIAERVRQAMTPEGFTRMRVLVVDDHPDSADALAAVLDLLGCPVRACYSGSTALEVAEQFAPQVCLLDLRMPGIDGLELASHLKQRVPDRPPLLVATTALADAETKARTTQAGFHYHLIKPIDVSTLIETLTRLGEIISHPTDPNALPD
jgi:CheY-like chemotaxis protein